MGYGLTSWGMRWGDPAYWYGLTDVIVHTSISAEKVETQRSISAQSIATTPLVSVTSIRTLTVEKS